VIDDLSEVEDIDHFYCMIHYKIYLVIHC